MKRIATTLVALALVVPLGAALAIAEEPQPNEERRKVVVRSTPSEAVFELSREDRANQDKVTMRFSTAEGVMSALYENEEEDQDVRYEKSILSRVHQVLEYRDDNGNQRFDEGEPVAGSWYLSAQAEDYAKAGTNSTVTWSPMQVQDIEFGGKKGKQATARAQFLGPPAGGLPIPSLPPMQPPPESYFQVDFTVFGDFLEYEETTLDPTEAKIDLNFHNYPFAEERTRLAVVYETSAKGDLDQVLMDEGPGLTGLASTKVLGDRKVTVEWSWKNEVEVDGRQLPVQMSPLITETVTKKDPQGTQRDARMVYALDYDRGNQIVHDPLLGVEIQDADKGGLIDIGKAPGPATWAVLVALAAALVWVGRRR